MTDNSVPDEVLGQMTRKFAEIVKRVSKGSLHPDDTLKGLQLLIEGHFAGVAVEKSIDNMRVSYAVLQHMTADEQLAHGRSALAKLKKVRPDLLGYRWAIEEVLRMETGLPLEICQAVTEAYFCSIEPHH